MRGTLLNLSGNVALLRIIPAHAGNTVWMKLSPDFRRDHPRACGEHGLIVAVVIAHKGSSPRMRGTLDAVAVGQAGHGIIPAHAGNTVALSLSSSAIWDHPRACGEHEAGAGLQTFGEGSSPRMRGTQSFVFALGRVRGIIPAHAGNTRDSSLSPRWRRDHPRACGEHSARSRVTVSTRGSSPRMRGTL